MLASRVNIDWSLGPIYAWHTASRQPPQVLGQKDSVVQRRLRHAAIFSQSIVADNVNTFFVFGPQEFIHNYLAVFQRKVVILQECIAGHTSCPDDRMALDGAIIDKQLVSRLALNALAQI